MRYRNGVYVAFDGNGTTNPTEGDMKYYGILQAWNSSEIIDFSFSDSHKKTNQVKDTSTIETLKKRLLERMKNSKSMLLIISKDTNWDRGMLNYEIEKAVDYYKIPIIIAYVGHDSINTPQNLSYKWPKSLKQRIDNGTAKCIHIGFKKELIFKAIKQVSIHTNVVDGPYYYYNN